MCYLSWKKNCIVKNTLLPAKVLNFCNKVVIGQGIWNTSKLDI